MSSKSIHSTKNYDLFEFQEGANRRLDLSKHRKLLESMKILGFLYDYPIICSRGSNGKWKIKDGQHRFTFARSLGLPIHWLEASCDFDIAITNSAAKPWVIRDYAEKHAANGKTAYKEGLDFADEYHLPIGAAFALLSGVTAFHHIQSNFIDGTFKIKDRGWANAVAGIYGPIVLMSKAVRNARFIEACMAVCRVEGFEPKRLLQTVEHCREKLVAYATKDAYLDMLEEIYNWKKSKLVSLKVAAKMAMKERNPAKSKAKPSDNGSSKAEEEGPF